MISELETVRLTQNLENGVEAGTLAVVLSVYCEPELSYEIEVVDCAGRTLFLGPVKADAIEPAQPSK